MFIANKELTCQWSLIEEANTGSSFLIQNIANKPVCYCVLDSLPDSNIEGGLLDPHQQLSFKKVSGDLYMKKTWGGNESVCLHIEQVEA